MNQLLKIHFEIQREDRIYVFELPAGCPTGEAYDVVHEMLQKILEIAKTNASAAAHSKPVDPIIEGA